ncbi:MAG: hypothetical protein IRZ28_22550 [Steroidobacteraceae bacterium]|nr:hypothetical protein [Steroidobacteraceae bacterium]
MRLLAAAIVLAGAMISGAIAWQGRTRAIPIHGGYVWEDRWTDTIEVCAAIPGLVIEGARHTCFKAADLSRD